VDQARASPRRASADKNEEKAIEGEHGTEISGGGCLQA
jgi:hypothetical protein